MPEILLAVVDMDESKNQSACILFMGGQADVRYAVQDGILDAAFEPNDPWYVNASQWAPRKVNAPPAWDVIRQSPVGISFLDTGVYCAHPDLTANCHPLSEPNNPACRGKHHHGTHVMGIAAAVLDNGVGIAGMVNVQARMYNVFQGREIVQRPGEYPTVTYCSGAFSLMAKKVVDATNHGGRILSMSFGTGCPDNLCKPQEDAIKYAYGRGVLLVASAGNCADCGILYPAAYPEVIAVTATNEQDLNASFSSFGPDAEIAAPGVNISSTITPDNVATQCMADPIVPICILDGTSMAAPLVSAVASMVWARCPSLSRDSIRHLLQNATVDLGSAGRDDAFGFGRIDAYDAVQRADLACA